MALNRIGAVHVAAVFIKKGDKTLANDEKHDTTKSDVCIYPSIIILLRMVKK